MSRSLLVYDGSTPWLRAAANQLTCGVEGLEAVPWQADAIQSFLEAQFGGRPFVFMLVDGDGVHVGSETVERVLRRRGVNAGVARALARMYPTAAKPVGRAIHGREPADIDGTFELTREARAVVDPLRTARTIPVSTE